MGASGAGKTTLLNVLAQRVPTGVVTGEVRVDGRALNESFQRTTGYVQQQDLHLESTTVREALQFSALLRQPKSIPTAEKLSYVNEVIVLLDMTEFADAVVGIPGLGLNVEQRKLLSIGVELAAKPEFLLFLDEPTSGLDSQSAWAIVKVLRRLANHGTAILCTIHQPSSVLFQEFDRLLLLAKGGKTVYFGDIGSNSATLINYFTSHGGASCDPEANPAEWMLQVLNAQNHDWHQAWLQSTERESVHEELQSLQAKVAVVKVSSPEASSEFAMPLMQQIQQTTIRVFQQYWRTPEYIWAKLLLGTLAALSVKPPSYRQSKLTFPDSSASPSSNPTRPSKASKTSCSPSSCSRPSSPLWSSKSCLDSSLNAPSTKCGNGRPKFTLGKLSYLPMCLSKYPGRLFSQSSFSSATTTLSGTGSTPTHKLTKVKEQG